MALDLQNASTPCKKVAEESGAYAYVDGLCFPVQGKTIKIGPSGHSMMEGFEICNFNMHTNGNSPPAPSPVALPGPVDGFQYGV